MTTDPQPIFSYRPYWAKRFLPVPFLPVSRDEMTDYGWDSCDVILVTGDAYVDHPSFAMAVVGRVLEAQGFRVGIISQPDWTSVDDFRALGRPNLFFGVTAGNMDSMVNRYTADRKIRRDDAYTPGAEEGKRPDRSTLVYAQRCREAYKDVPIVLGGIEASLRRIAHYDYWSDKVRKSILVDAKADLLVFGNGERQVVEIAHRLARKEPIDSIRDIRGTAFLLKELPADHTVVDSSTVDDIENKAKSAGTDNPYEVKPCQQEKVEQTQVARLLRKQNIRALAAADSVIKMPGYEQVRKDLVLYSHASRVMHLETNPYNARPLVQQHGNRYLWLNPPVFPLSTEELDAVFALPYQRRAHPLYDGKRIPAYEMIRFSVNIMRGCFGGCTFCSITEHEGRIIQNRSEQSIVNEIETIRDNVPGFTGVISDVGGPTANMYRLACKSRQIEHACRKLSCVYPGICKNLNTSHSALIGLYKKVREIPGIKKVLVASGLRYDLAVESPEYIKELVTHHVGGYLKIAPEHTESEPLSKMMKPGMDSYERFRTLFERYSTQAGKKQYLIPYFIAAHPGTRDVDMLNLALWLKRENYRLDQVQTFLPSPMALATAMYHTGKNPLAKVNHKSESVTIPRGLRIRRRYKAFLRYHDPQNWPILRDALREMGRADLIGNGKRHLVPTWQPGGTEKKQRYRK